MNGAVSLVTGASRGLGRALCELMVTRGDTVVGVSRGESSLVSPLYHHMIADISQEAEVVALFSAVRAIGPVSLLVNNAGRSLSRPALFTSAEAFNAVIGTNLLGTFIVSREAVKGMKRHRYGRIVNITSINVRLASAGAAAYNASKAALETLGRTLSNEIPAAEDITVNSLGVSLVDDTGMAGELSEAALAQKRVQLSRPAFLDVAEILAAIDFFASPQAKNITGQTLYFGGVS